MDRTRRMAIATEIMRQLGGGRFRAMTGARFPTALASGVRFSIGRNAKKVNCVQVTLTPSDDYTIEFLAVRKGVIKQKARVSGVYCDNLQAVFTTHTGMYTTL